MSTGKPLHNLRKLQIEYSELLDRQRFEEKDLDYGILDYHTRFLDQLDVIESSSISIFDLFKRDHVYFSRKFESVFGWDLEKAHREGAAYANRKIHPDDVIPMWEAGNHFFRMAFDVPPAIRKDYKVVQEYRITWKSGEWVRVVEQMMILENDRHGNIWLGLCLMDLAPDQNADLPYKSRIINYRTGEVLTFKPSGAKGITLTVRESEILQHIADGKMSKEIADQLSISIHTVNTHRQRILEKLQADSSIEAIRYAREHGIIE